MSTRNAWEGRGILSDGVTSQLSDVSQIPSNPFHITFSYILYLFVRWRITCIIALYTCFYYCPPTFSVGHVGALASSSRALSREAALQDAFGAVDSH